jgi:hypothetical protein
MNFYVTKESFYGRVRTGSPGNRFGEQILRIEAGTDLEKVNDPNLVDVYKLPDGRFLILSMDQTSLVRPV